MFLYDVFIMQKEFIMSIRGIMFFIGLVVCFSAAGAEAMTTILTGGVIGLALMAPYAIMCSKEK